MTAAASALLTATQEQDLGRRIQHGDESAFNTLVEANLRFAKYIANRYRRERVDIDDMIQEASIGLMQAARHFDPEKGVRFTSYSGWWIEAQLRRYVSRNSSSLRIGDATQRVARSLRRVEERLLQEHHKATLPMVAHEAGVDLAAAAFALGSATAIPLSLDRAMGDVEGEFTLQDLVADDSTEAAFDHAEEEMVLAPLLAQMDPRQHRILRLRFGENRTCGDIGHELGLSGSRVQQIEVQAIRSLRHRIFVTPRIPTREMFAAYAPRPAA
jgi:RNA polymerase primary sigma factor